MAHQKIKSAGARFVIVTGLSGSGKSQAIHALEDRGFFCVDNLPSALMPTLADLVVHTEGENAKAAVVVDVREGKYLSDFPKIFRRMRKDTALSAVLIFLEASNATLVRRFSETRRPHPLSHGGSVTKGIREERTRLKAIRRLADQVIDTSEMTVHDLRNIFMGLSLSGSKNSLAVSLTSFGFKYGVPTDADLVFDVRFLPNPYFVDALRRLTGRSRAVKNFLMKHAETRALLEKLTDLLTFLVPEYVREGKSYLTIAIGCTGGRHRSIAIVEELKSNLQGISGAQLQVVHRDWKRESVADPFSRPRSD